VFTYLPNSTCKKSFRQIKNVNLKKVFGL